MVKAGTIISSCGPIPQADKMVCRADVPLFTATAYFVSDIFRANLCSNNLTYSPAEEIHDDFMALTRYFSSLPEMSGSQTGIMFLPFNIVSFRGRYFTNLLRTFFGI